MFLSESSSSANSGQEREPQSTDHQISAGIDSAVVSNPVSPWDYIVTHVVTLGDSRKPLNGRFDEEARFETWKLDEIAVAFRRLREDEDEKSDDPKDRYPRVELRGDQDIWWYYRDNDSRTLERLVGIAGRQIESGYQWIKEHDYDVHAALGSGVNATEGVYEHLLDRYKLAYQVGPAMEKDKQHISVYQVDVRTGYQQLLMRSPPETTPADICAIAPTMFPSSCMSAMALSANSNWIGRCSLDAYDRRDRRLADFQTFLVPYEEERRRRLDLMVLAGSTPNGETWEDCMFSLDLDALNETTMDTILSDMGRKTLFALDPRVSGDHDSVVVVTNETIRRHMRRVETNVSDFLNRPLLEPCEFDCVSESRIIEYAEMLCENGLCVLAAATMTRCYFGVAFDRTFRSYEFFSDLLLSTLGKRLKHVITDENELVRVGSELMGQTSHSSGYDRLYYFALGGDRPGGFESTLGESYVIEYARRYTRIHEGALVVTVLPRDSLARVRIFQHGQFRMFHLGQLREATWAFCQLRTRTVINDWEILAVNRFLDGCVSYCVRRHRSSDAELQVKYIGDLCSFLPSRPAQS